MAKLIGEGLDQLMVKEIFLLYAPVRSETDPPYAIGTYENKFADGDYTAIWGLLKDGGDGSQAEPSTETIDAKYFDAPFVSIPTAQPFEKSVTLVKYTLKELHEFLGGDAINPGGYTPATATVKESWRAPKGSPILMYEFVYGYATGKMRRIFNGQVTYNSTEPSTGAAGFNIKISANANHAGWTTEEIGFTS